MPIRRVIDLLALLRKPGAKLVQNQKWELGQVNQWREFEVIEADGRRHQVDARIAVVAHRKGLVKLQGGV